MVIAHTIGGLGNQLFQYAAARSIAERFQVPVKLDVSAFSAYKLRDFDLDKFNVHFDRATEAEIALLKPGGNLAKALQYLRPKPKRTYHRERSYRYDKSFAHIGPDVYIKGYFQSEKYFLPIASLLRKEFTIKEDYVKSVQDLGQELRQPGSVAIHIRRGDYTDPEILRVHGILPVEYYKSAIAYIRDRVPSSRFYFFSNDMEWTKQHLPLESAVYVSGLRTKDHFEDFYLMSQCHHNIIANSSYSWWTAWLNNHPDKIVIAPKNWFTEKKNNYDRTPDSWLRM